jgi:hypothetical protein
MPVGWSATLWNELSNSPHPDAEAISVARFGESENPKTDKTWLFLAKGRDRPKQKDDWHS